LAKQKKLGEEVADEFFLRSISFKLVDFFIKPGILTRDRRLHFPSEESLLGIVIALKNPSSSAVFEPANLGSNARHANR
jgi:hypothetical protein